jgi:hypothetical protein
LKQSDDFIKKALDDEMGLLKNMGVNTVRIYTGIPAKWITYIYENYGIYTCSITPSEDMVLP